jgi:hypothetical protein
LLAAASLPQEKPSAAASGSTAQRSTKHCQCSNDYRRPASKEGRWRVAKEKESREKKKEKERKRERKKKKWGKREGGGKATKPAQHRTVNLVQHRNKNPKKNLAPALTRRGARDFGFAKARVY